MDFFSGLPFSKGSLLVPSVRFFWVVLWTGNLSYPRVARGVCATKLRGAVLAHTRSTAGKDEHGYAVLINEGQCDIVPNGL
jgi:hypothetical protein